MGKINDRNFQLRLAFQDDDLRKPKHDEIMHWLDQWVKTPDNLREFIPDWDERSFVEESGFDRPTEELIRDSKFLESIRAQLKRDFPAATREKATQKWDGEPQMPIEFVRRTWEPMLHKYNDRDAMIGFCDYEATFKIGRALQNVTRHVKAMKTADPNSESTQWHRKWTIDSIETIQFFRPLTGDIKIYFEAKTEIKSIGELMRQLQLYWSSREIGGAFNENRVTTLIVVAPPHPEAAEVLRSHGFGFLPYLP